MDGSLWVGKRGEGLFKHRFLIKLENGSTWSCANRAVWLDCLSPRAFAGWPLGCTESASSRAAGAHEPDKREAVKSTNGSAAQVFSERNQAFKTSTPQGRVTSCVESSATTSFHYLRCSISRQR